MRERIETIAAGLLVIATTVLMCYGMAGALQIRDDQARTATQVAEEWMRYTETATVSCKPVADAVECEIERTSGRLFTVRCAAGELACVPVHWSGRKGN